MSRAEVRDVLATLERKGTTATRDGMSRYGIVAPKAFGVTMADMQKIAKPIGANHALALALWETGWYEARTVAAFVADPERMTAAEMDRWCRDSTTGPRTRLRSRDDSPNPTTRRSGGSAGTRCAS